LAPTDTHLFKEGDAYVAYVPALDISSCGDTDKDARRNIRDAVRGFLATSADMGTLGEILEEAGYRQEGSIGWLQAGFQPASRFR
jgi:predicted RNase H-like HicB family nuclease